MGGANHHKTYKSTKKDYKKPGCNSSDIIGYETEIYETNKCLTIDYGMYSVYQKYTCSTQNEISNVKYVWKSGKPFS